MIVVVTGLRDGLERSSRGIVTRRYGSPQRRAQRSRRVLADGAVHRFAVVVNFERAHRATAGMLESMCQALEIRDDESVPFTLDEAVGREPTQHEGNGFTRGTDELAEEAPRQHGRGDAWSVAVYATLRETQQSCDEPLFDGEGRVLAEALEELGALRHDLTHERERGCRLLPHESADP